jgi:hypothetical protein
MIGQGRLAHTQFLFQGRHFMDSPAGALPVNKQKMCQTLPQWKAMRGQKR